MSSNVPAIVLVHGSWHVPAHYAKLAGQLREAGFNVFVPHLPTCDEAHRAGASMYDDATKVRSQVTELVDRGHDVIMLLHSYGGVAGTEALKGLSKAERQKTNQPGGVIHLIYMCAFLLQVDESLVSASLPRPVPDPVLVDIPNGITTFCEPPVKLFYADVDLEEAKKMETLLVPQSARAPIDILTYAAWKDIPSTYLMASNDLVLLPHWQKRQLQAVKDAGVSIAVKQYDCSHSPFLSRTNEMVDVVKEVAF